MKKLFTLSIVIAAAALVVFASCEKNKTYSYICTCTENQYLTGNTSGNQVHTFTVTDATTNNVQSKCDMQMNAVLNNSGQSFSCTYK
jgi:hypothetical protein